MSSDDHAPDPTGFAPPFEMRIPLGSVVDTSDGVSGAMPTAGTPAPSAIAGGSPGVTTAAMAPPIAPSLPDLSDPSQVALLISKMWGEHMTGASLIPTPTPAQVGSGTNLPSNVASPGASLPSMNGFSNVGADSPSQASVPSSSSYGASDPFALTLAPADLDAPPAAGLPQSPSGGGGAPSLPSGGGSYPVVGSTALPVGAAPTNASLPTSVAPAPDTSSNVPHASTQPTAPAIAGPAAHHRDHRDDRSPSDDNRGSHRSAPDSSHPAGTPARDGSSHAQPPSGAAPQGSPAYQHGGTSSGGDARYGAPPDFSSMLGHSPFGNIAATPTGLPRYTDPLPTPPISPSMAPDPQPIAQHLGAPTGVTAPPTTASTQPPIATGMPSAPFGAPQLPSSANVPSSAPFGAPIDFGGMIANPTHISIPVLTEPSTSAPNVASQPRHDIVPVDNDVFAQDVRFEVPDGRGKSGSDPLVRDLGHTAFDPYRVREDFPILGERVHGGKPLVWLDNAATTQKPRAVIDRLSYFYAHENSNVHRAAHTLAARSTDAFERARESARRFINAPSSKEIVWVRGTTEGINFIAKSWGQKFIEKGDEIVITHLEHHANIVPWQMLCAAKGAKLRVAPVDDRGDVILEAYERLLGPRTKLVSIPQVSNALGTITPTKRMVEIAHRYGAHVMVDGAQSVSHMKVDVQDLGCDWFVFSGHKVFGPTGIGVVWGKADVLAVTPPWQGGGNMIEDVTFEHTKFHPPPWRFEAGTANIADAVGLGAAIEYVERIGMDVIDRYEHELLVYGTQRLHTVPGLKIIGTSKSKAGVLSFVLDGQRTEDVSAILDKDGIAVRSGHHCAQPILRRFGLEATVRASLAFYNVCEDIDALVESLHRLQAGRAKRS